MTDYTTKKECDLIDDIIPLYTEHMVSDYTKELVDNHMAHCEYCRKKLDAFENTAFHNSENSLKNAETIPLTFLKKKLFQKKLQIFLCTFALALALVASAFAFLTTPQYIPYSEDLLTVTPNADNTVTITFLQDVPHIRVTDNGHYAPVQEFNLEAWTTPLDKIFPSTSYQSTTLGATPERPLCIYYLQNDASDSPEATDILLYDSTNSHDSQGRITLARSILGFYFILAVVLFIFFTVITLLFKKKNTQRVWMLRITLLPFSYLLGQLFTKGLHFRSYSTTHDFFCNIFVGLLFYLAFLFLILLYRRHQLEKESSTTN